MTETRGIPLSQFQEFDSRRVVSKLVHDSERCRVALFCLEPGQQIPPHVTTSEVVFYGVEGKGTILVGKDEVGLEAGSLVVCPPQEPHGIKAAQQRATVLAIIAPRPQ